MASPFRLSKENKMAKFDDFLTHVDLSNGIPDGFIDGLRSAYNEDLSIPTSKVETLESEKSTLLSQLTEKEIGRAHV